VSARAAPIEQLQTKAFSTSSLVESIQFELAEEATNGLNGMPDELSDLHSKIALDWTIVDSSSVGSNSGALVNMYKKEPLENGAKVTISFHCQDTMEMDGFSEMFGEDDEDDEIAAEPSNPLRFEVKIVKAGTNMNIGCTSEEGTPSVDAITFVQDGVEEEDLYKGPVLEELNEKLQGELTVFLKEECGINDDTASFLAMYADYREQVEYVQWLENLKKVVS
jgi:hypothetical protein